MKAWEKESLKSCLLYKGCHLGQAWQPERVSVWTECRNHKTHRHTWIHPTEANTADDLDQSYLLSKEVTPQREDCILISCSWSKLLKFELTISLLHHSLTSRCGLLQPGISCLRVKPATVRIIVTVKFTSASICICSVQHPATIFQWLRRSSPQRPETRNCWTWPM